MAIVERYKCDACHRVFEHECTGMIIVRADTFSVIARIGINYIGSDHRETRLTAGQELHFCNIKCLEKLISDTEELIKSDS